jgi:hypothetical protein
MEREASINDDEKGNSIESPVSYLVNNDKILAG